MQYCEEISAHSGTIIRLIKACMRPSARFGACINPQVVLLVGDMAYADNYWPNGTVRPPATNLTTYWHPTYPPRWDSWHRFVQPLASKVPFFEKALYLAVCSCCSTHCNQ